MRIALAAMAMGAAALVPASASASASASARVQDDGAGHIVIYRCTDAAGRVTIQNDVPCPKGSREHRETVETPAPVPAYVPPDLGVPDQGMPAVAAPEHAQDPAGPATRGAGDAPAAPPGPPPALYACRTWDQVDYLTEDATPHTQCAPLQVVGIDGAARSDASACEKVVDQCEPVPSEQLCAAWRRRVSEAEFRWKFAGAKEDDARRRDYEALAATLSDSDCQKP
jgi:hypothetical protein